MTRPVSPLPPGLPVELDAGVRRHDRGRVLVGGSPRRVLRLGPEGPAALAALLGGEPGSPAARRLGRVLVDAGLAHPRPAPVPASDRTTVVVPVRDRPAGLARLLAALDPGLPVVVVDDGSADAAAVATVCRRHGARLLRHPVARGPAAARNTGLRAVGTELVAFLDSDCRPGAGWLDLLAGHLVDPQVGAVAPRIASPAPRDGSLLARFAAAHSPLDLGPRPAVVRPGTRVGYVPTAALLARREVLPEGGFDERLRYGEDVDLVWRLHDAGHQVRYDPTVVVSHDEPRTWSGWMARRARYGTSAGALARRHPGRLHPAVLAAWPGGSTAALLAGRPWPAAAATAVPVARLTRRLRRSGLPWPAAAAVATRSGLAATAATLDGVARTAGTLAPPLLVALAARPGRPRRAAIGLTVLPPLARWAARRPAVDPLRWVALSRLDDTAYGLGVWWGCLHHRTARPLLPSPGPAASP